ncbi:MAG: aspartate carbamoyltransferase regulatory subunit, partial [Sulfolobales archaeon]
MSNATLTVSKIRSGTVIDHIPSGKAIEVLRILGITGREGYRMAILMNVESRKLGRKDVIKIEGKFLDAKELNLIALVAPTATINIVEEFEVRKKFRVAVPDVV